AKNKDDKGEKDVAAKALRMSFKTDRPLFPYREPNPTKAAKALAVEKRLLRIYFIAEARYQGELTRQKRWTGGVAWAGKVSEADRKDLLEKLKLPATTGPANWWLTEFEDDWAYESAPADVYFSRSAEQKSIKRPTIHAAARWPRDVSVYAIAAVL